MASIRKHPRSPYWIASYRKPCGTATNRSTRLPNDEKNRKRALKIAESFEEAYRANDVLQHAAKTLDEISRSLGGPSVGVKVADYSQQWLDNAKKTKAPATAGGYTTSVLRWLQWLEQERMVDTLLSRITRPDVIRFRDWVAEESSANAANKDVKIVAQILSAALEDGFLERNVAAKVPALRLEEKLEREPFTRDDLRALWQACADSLDWRTMLMLGLFTGQRLTDLASLRWEEVDFERREVRIKTAKTGRDQRCFLPAPLRSWLGQIQPAEPTGPICETLYDLDKRYVSKKFVKLLESTNIDLKMRKVGNKTFRRKSFHSLRHTLPTLLIEQGTHARVIQEIIGHDSAEMTKRYSHAERGQIEDALGRLSNPFDASV